MERIPGIRAGAERKGHDYLAIPAAAGGHDSRSLSSDLNGGSKDSSNGLGNSCAHSLYPSPSQACIESSVKLRRAGRWERDTNEDHAKITPSKTTAATPPRPNHSLCGREIATGGSAPDRKPRLLLQPRRNFRSRSINPPLRMPRRPPHRHPVPLRPTHSRAFIAANERSYLFPRFEAVVALLRHNLCWSYQYVNGNMC